jgi:hypothetical protein
MSAALQQSTSGTSTAGGAAGQAAGSQGASSAGAGGSAAAQGAASSGSTQGAGQSGSSNPSQGAGEGGSLLEQGFQAGKGDPAAADPASGKPGEKAPEGEKKQGEGAPEKYEDFKAPEGVKTDQAVLEEFKTLAKSMNLSQENAQKIFDLQVKGAQAQDAAKLNQYKEVAEGWKQETLQALGPEYPRELAIAAKAIDRFGTPALRQMLNDSSLGSHKEFVSFFVKVGKALSEDTFADGRQSAAAERSAAQVLYPNQGK